MVKQTIIVKGITESKGKSGSTYFLIDTDQGKMSCFPDYKGLDDLRTAWKNDAEIEVNVETSDDGRFKNIRNEKAGSNNQTRASVKGSAYEKDPVGLAVEVFNSIFDWKEIDNITEVMNSSIQVVKQAQKAFS